MKAAALLAAALVASGCGGAAARFIAEAREANAAADAFLLSGAPDRAAQALDRVRALQVPAGLAAADRRALLQDLDVRRATLALEAADAARAQQICTAGLALGEGRDVLTAALLILRGRAHEVLGHDADAVRDYEAAQAIDEALLDGLLRQGKP